MEEKNIGEQQVDNRTNEEPKAKTVADAIFSKEGLSAIWKALLGKKKENSK